MGWTYFGGVNYFIYASDQFRIYPYGNSPNHLSGKAVRQIINTPDNGLYIATEDGGLNYLNSNREITRSGRLHERMNIKARNIHSLLIDSKQNLWIGLFLRGMNYYMPKENKTLSFNDGMGKNSSGFWHHRGRNRQNLVWRAVGTIYLEETERQFPVKKSFCTSCLLHA